MPMNPSLYPANWHEIAARVKEEAGWKCEKCGVTHVLGLQSTLLTVHHIDHDPSYNARSNLVALCARCHLQADAPWHTQNAAETRRLKKLKQQLGTGQLILLEEP